MDGLLLVGNSRVLRTTGSRTNFSDPRDAADALRRGQAAFVAGALPFDPAEPAALAEPTTITWSAPEPPTAAETIPARVTHYTPPPDEHRDLVARHVATIASSELQKVVAARSVTLHCDVAVDPEALAGQLFRASPAASCFAVALPRDTTLVGASPELLVRKRGNRISLHPLAGTVRRDPDPAIDQQLAADLLSSKKNLDEHAFVTDWVREQLAPITSELSIPARPELYATDSVWHLGTPTVGTLSDQSLNALDVALRLHPTPAVCGTPTELALDAIRATEAPRGFYAGAVGWTDSAGDGDWVVAIRSARISTDGHEVEVYAGGGIVADSDPQSELDETDAKLRGMLAQFALS